MQKTISRIQRLLQRLKKLLFSFSIFIYPPYGMIYQIYDEQYRRDKQNIREEVYQIYTIKKVPHEICELRE